MKAEMGQCVHKPGDAKDYQQSTTSMKQIVTQSPQGEPALLTP